MNYLVSIDEGGLYDVWPTNDTIDVVQAEAKRLNDHADSMGYEGHYWAIENTLERKINKKKIFKTYPITSFAVKKAT